MIHHAPPLTHLLPIAQLLAFLSTGCDEAACPKGSHKLPGPRCVADDGGTDASAVEDAGEGEGEGEGEGDLDAATGLDASSGADGGSGVDAGTDGGVGADAGTDAGAASDAGRDSGPCEGLDGDEDGILDCEDNCQAITNADQSNVDADSSGDACDPCVGYPGDDGAACENRSFPASPGDISAALLHDGRVLFVGTFDGTDPETALPLLEGWLYDPADDSFSRISGDAPSLHVGGTAVTLLDGSVLLIGGEAADGGVAGIDRYDPGADGFDNFGTLRVGRSEHEAIVLDDGRVLVIGGTTVDEDTFTWTTEIVDGETVSDGPDLPADMGGKLGAVKLQNGDVLLTGGCDAQATPSQSAALFDADDDTISVLPSLMLAPRWGHRMALLGDGTVVLLGGAGNTCFSGELIALRSVELYDPVDQAFEEADSTMPYHFRSSVLSLGDGTAIALGGGRDFEEFVEDRVSRFDSTGPLVQEPYVAADLQVPRTLIERSGVMLQDGSVFIAGGGTSFFTMADTAERYFPYYGTIVDRDFDMVVDVLDNCPEDVNANQTDSNANGVGDACE